MMTTDLDVCCIQKDGVSNLQAIIFQLELQSCFQKVALTSSSGRRE